MGSNSAFLADPLAIESTSEDQTMFRCPKKRNIQVRLQKSGEKKIIKIFPQRKKFEIKSNLLKKIKIKSPKIDILMQPKSIILLKRMLQTEFLSNINKINLTRKRKGTNNVLISTPKKKERLESSSEVYFKLRTPPKDNNAETTVLTKRSRYRKSTTPIKERTSSPIKEKPKSKESTTPIMETKSITCKKVVVKLSKSSTKPSNKKLYESFGKQFFKCHVRIKKIPEWNTLNLSDLKSELEFQEQMIHLKKKLNCGLNKSVSFLETVEVFGESDSETSATEENITEKRSDDFGGELVESSSSVQNNESINESNVNENVEAMEKIVRTKITFSPLKSSLETKSSRDKLLRLSDEKIVRTSEFIDDDKDSEIENQFIGETTEQNNDKNDLPQSLSSKEMNVIDIESNQNEIEAQSLPSKEMNVIEIESNENENEAQSLSSKEMNVIDIESNQNKIEAQSLSSKEMHVIDIESNQNEIEAKVRAFDKLRTNSSSSNDSNDFLINHVKKIQEKPIEQNKETLINDNERLSIISDEDTNDFLINHVKKNDEKQIEQNRKNILNESDGLLNISDEDTNDFLMNHVKKNDEKEIAQKKNKILKISDDDSNDFLNHFKNRNEEVLMEEDNDEIQSGQNKEILIEEDDLMDILSNAEPKNNDTTKNLNDSIISGQSNFEKNVNVNNDEVDANADDDDNLSQDKSLTKDNTSLNKTSISTKYTFNKFLNSIKVKLMPGSNKTKNNINDDTEMINDDNDICQYNEDIELSTDINDESSALLGDPVLGGREMSF